MKKLLFIFLMFNCEFIRPVKKNPIKEIQIKEGTLGRSKASGVLLKGPLDNVKDVKTVMWEKGKTLKEVLAAHEIPFNPGDILSTDSKIGRFKEIVPEDNFRIHAVVIVWRARTIS